ncbi:proteasome assembly chaperone family protein [Halobaculum sp. P14]|uniref:proteasome assembly chaperone family protein n=1 Tax=Halobaculum sp. P14 TaxID=3421638 RepID=UPI003EB9757F
MAHVDVVSDADLHEPVLVEGLPGVGLVGKIAVDHLVDQLDMEHYANVHCEALPKAAAYGGGDSTLRTPVRLYAAPEADLLALQSDVTVSPDAAAEFAGCIADWFAEASVTPLYVAGLERDEPSDGAPRLRGVAAGEGDAVLDRVGVSAPDEPGIVSGPAGALLSHALATDQTAVGLVVDADPKFPDPIAAQAVLEACVEPIADVDVDSDRLESQATQIQRAKEQFAEEVHEDGENASRAHRLRMYQ